MCVNAFRVLLFHIQFAECNVCKYRQQSLFKLFSGLPNIFLIATASDNYIYKVGNFTA